jgi:hypothetical protein
MNVLTKKKLRKRHQDWAGAEVVKSKILAEVAVVLDDDQNYSPISIYRKYEPSPSPLYSLSVEEAEELVHTLKTMIKAAKKARNDY